MIKTYKQIDLSEYINHYNSFHKYDVKKYGDIKCWLCFKNNCLDNMTFCYIHCYAIEGLYTLCGRFCDESCMNLYILNGGKGFFPDIGYA